MTYPALLLVGIAAPRPGSGKTTIAADLISRGGFARLPFAEPLKRIGCTVLKEAGVPELDARRYLYIDRGSIIPGVGVNGRHFLQTLGTDWGRRLIHPHIWIRLWQSDLKAMAESARLQGCQLRVVVDDVRFPNEADLIRSLGGSMWWVERPRTRQEIRSELRRRLQPSFLLRSLLRPWRLFAPAHASEGLLGRYPHFDATFRNDGTIEELAQQVWPRLVQLLETPSSPALLASAARRGAQMQSQLAFRSSTPDEPA